MAARARPLSPHLQIYRFTLTMTMSIVHRITGLGLYFGTLLLVAWLGAAALGEGPLGVVNAIFGSWPVQVILFLATWALIHHLLGGLRHFVWDQAKAMDPAGRENLVRLNLVLSIILTVVVWALFVWF